MEEMDEFERRLEGALRRVEAPRGFAERVVASAEAERQVKVLAWPRRQAWMSGALAAGLLLGAVAGEGLHVQHEAKRRAVAEAQFETAMRVTDRTLEGALESTRRQVSRAGVRLDLQ